MISERNAGAILVWAPAKVNLFLEVLGKRADGYHEIATFMVAVSLWDTLCFQEVTDGEIVVQCDRAELSTGPDNLICRAAERLRQRTGCHLGAGIRLRKRIPLAAGLAGGSSDAAAALAGLNQLWRLQLSKVELKEVAAAIGSDVPFFFETPAAWGTGRGEVVEPVTLPKAMWFVLACPPFGVATADVYRNVVVPEVARRGNGIQEAVNTGDVEKIAAELHNRLESATRR